MTYDVAGKLRSSSLQKRASCTTRNGCGSKFVFWRERADVQAESTQTTGEDQTGRNMRQAAVNEGKEGRSDWKRM